MFIFRGVTIWWKWKKIEHHLHFQVSKPKQKPYMAHIEHYINHATKGRFSSFRVLSFFVSSSIPQELERWCCRPYHLAKGVVKHSFQGSCIRYLWPVAQHKSITSWWLNQPIWKICSSNWIISPGRDENKKYLKPAPRLNQPPPVFPHWQRRHPRGSRMLQKKISLPPTVAGWDQKT